MTLSHISFELKLSSGLRHNLSLKITVKFFESENKFDLLGLVCLVLEIQGNASPNKIASNTSALLIFQLPEE